MHSRPGPLVRPRRGSPVLEGHMKAHERSMRMKGSSCYDRYALGWSQSPHSSCPHAFGAWSRHAPERFAEIPIIPRLRATSGPAIRAPVQFFSAPVAVAVAVLH